MFTWAMFILIALFLFLCICIGVLIIGRIAESVEDALYGRTSSSSSGVRNRGERAKAVAQLKDKWGLDDFD